MTAEVTGHHRHSPDRAPPCHSPPAGAPCFPAPGRPEGRAQQAVLTRALGQSPHRGQGGPVSRSTGASWGSRLGSPAGLPVRNAGLRQTLPSQRHFLTCWGLEKETQTSDRVQEVQPSLSSGRCSAPPLWTRPSTPCGSRISVQPVSLWPLAWGHTPWRGLEGAGALVALCPTTPGGE